MVGVGVQTADSCLVQFLWTPLCWRPAKRTVELHRLGEPPLGFNKERQGWGKVALTTTMHGSSRWLPRDVQELTGKLSRGNPHPQSELQL